MIQEESTQTIPLDKTQRKALHVENSRQVGYVRNQYKTTVKAARAKRDEQLLGLSRALRFALENGIPQ